MNAYFRGLSEVSLREHLKTARDQLAEMRSDAEYFGESEIREQEEVVAELALAVVDEKSTEEMWFLRWTGYEHIGDRRYMREAGYGGLFASREAAQERIERLKEQAASDDGARPWSYDYELFRIQKMGLAGPAIMAGTTAPFVKGYR